MLFAIIKSTKRMERISNLKREVEALKQRNEAQEEYIVECQKRLNLKFCDYPIGDNPQYVFLQLVLQGIADAFTEYEKHKNSCSMQECFNLVKQSLEIANEWKERFIFVNNLFKQNLGDRFFDNTDKIRYYETRLSELDAEMKKMHQKKGA